MDNDTGKDPKALPDEALDEAAGGITFQGQQPSDAAITDGTSNVTDGTSKAGYGGYLGGVRVAVGDVNNDGTALKIADGSVKPGA